MNEYHNCMEIFRSVVDSITCLPSMQSTFILPNRSPVLFGNPHFSTSRKLTSCLKLQGSYMTGLSQSEHSTPGHSYWSRLKGRTLMAQRSERESLQSRGQREPQ